MRRPINIAIVIMAVHIVPDIILTEQKQDAFLTHMLEVQKRNHPIISKNVNINKKVTLFV